MFLLQKTGPQICSLEPLTVANVEINVAKFPNVTLSCNNLKPNLKTPYPWPVSSLMINTNQFDFRLYDSFFAFLRHDFKRKAWNIFNKMYLLLIFRQIWHSLYYFLSTLDYLLITSVPGCSRPWQEKVPQNTDRKRKYIFLWIPNF